MEWEGKTTHQKVTGFIKCQVLPLDLKKKKEKRILKKKTKTNKHQKPKPKTIHQKQLS